MSSSVKKYFLTLYVSDNSFISDVILSLSLYTALPFFEQQNVQFPVRHFVETAFFHKNATLSISDFVYINISREKGGENHAETVMPHMLLRFEYQK